MSITTTNNVDDTNKVITSVSGIGGETEQLLLDVSKLNKADSSPRLSIENIHYEIQGTGKINLYWDAKVDEEILELSGYGNYGLIPSEKNKEISSTTSIPNGDVLLTSDSDVKKYNLVLEFKKETGFTAS